MAFTPPSLAPASRRVDLQPAAGSSAVLTAVVVVMVIAGLYFGRDVLVPIALSILLSFALAPPVRWLRRLHVPRLPAVLFVVLLAGTLILAFSAVVAWQVADLGQRLPAYQKNIEAKIETFTESPPGGRMFDRATRMIRELGRKIDAGGTAPAAADAATPADTEAAKAQQPQPVTIVEPDQDAMQLLRVVVGPLIAPLATAGIVIVFVIFMLLKREDLRDRMIRLAGTNDLSRTTEAIDDAARRVGHYLLMQLVVNVTYGMPVAIGLWFIGVPNPLLWGMIATVLRFVPYIGPIIAAFFPLALALAVDPGWSTFLWTAGLLIGIELISNNAVEPWLYGSSTGLSPVAIIAAAIFWTWLWGPIGLLLSTPLTVCLVVLGQHVPRLSFLDVLFGNQPVLTPAESLYQRLLVGDADEATERAEECLRTTALAAYYDEIALPALALAEADRKKDMLDDERRAKVAESAALLIENLTDFEDDADAVATVEYDGAPRILPAGVEGPPVATPLTGHGGRVLCAGARGDLDDAAAAMLAQILEQQGATVETASSRDMQAARLGDLALDDVEVVVLSYLNADSVAHARFLVRRLKRRAPRITVIAGFWGFTAEDLARRDPTSASGADSVATSLRQAADLVGEALARERIDLPDEVPELASAHAI